MVRLSCVVSTDFSWIKFFSKPNLSRKALAERFTQNILNQKSSASEIIVVIAGADHGAGHITKNHLESIFGEAIALDRLNLVHLDRNASRAEQWNEGASRARGKYLTFSDLSPKYEPGYLTWINSQVKKRDLIFLMNKMNKRSSDLLKLMIQKNHLISNSIVVDHELFEKVGGFPEGKLAGDIQYSFLMRCLIEIQKNPKERILVSDNKYIKNEKLSTTQQKLNRAQELIALAAVARKIPSRYWLDIGKRLRQRLN